MLLEALSIKQPWAGLIVARIKPVENRSWKINRHIKNLAVCASQKPEPQWVFDMVREKLAGLGIPYPDDLCSINGACIGLVDHIGTVWMQDGKPWTDSPKRVRIPPDQLRVWWQDDQYGWVLDNQRLIEPVPVKGQLGIYKIDINIQYEER